MFSLFSLLNFTNLFMCFLRWRPAKKKITGWQQSNFGYRMNEMKNISNKNTICQKKSKFRKCIVDTDVNYLAAHVSTSGFLIMVTKAVFIFCQSWNQPHMIAQAHTHTDIHSWNPRADGRREKIIVIADSKIK